MRSRADYLSWLNCSWLIKLQELYVRGSFINQPWGELGAERRRNDVESSLVGNH